MERAMVSAASLEGCWEEEVCGCEKGGCRPVMSTGNVTKTPLRCIAARGPVRRAAAIQRALMFLNEDHTRTHS